MLRLVFLRDYLDELKAFYLDIGYSADMQAVADMAQALQQQLDLDLTSEIQDIYQQSLLSSSSNGTISGSSSGEEGGEGAGAALSKSLNKSISKTCYKEVFQELEEALAISLANEANNLTGRSPGLGLGLGLGKGTSLGDKEAAAYKIAKTGLQLIEKVHYFVQRSEQLVVDLTDCYNAQCKLQQQKLYDPVRQTDQESPRGGIKTEGSPSVSSYETIRQNATLDLIRIQSEFCMSMKDVLAQAQQGECERRELKSALLRMDSPRSLSNVLFYTSFSSSSNSSANNGTVGMSEEGAAGVGLGSWSVASLLVRTKSSLLLKSVFRTWPYLSVRVPVPGPTSQGQGAPTDAALTTSISRSLSSSSSFSSSSFAIVNNNNNANNNTNNNAGKTTKSANAKRSQSSPSQSIVRILARDVLIPEKIDFSQTQELRALGFTLTQLKCSHCYTLPQLLGAGYLPQELKEGNLTGFTYNVKDLRLAGLVDIIV